ncbi:MAG: hypothetical protein HW388_453 [Dehalococcoidia bacterium]|nr:hypothetical protein [Dehalococcoidia bacterium]
MWAMHDGYGMGWGWGVFGVVWMVLFWGSIIALVVWAISRMTRDSSGLPRSSTPLEIAKARYARGDITREEFERLRQDLS